MTEQDIIKIKHTRKCSYCHMEKLLSEFYSDKSRPSGLSYRCKTCDSAYIKTYEKLHREVSNRRRYDHISRYPQRQKARKLVASAIKKGLLSKKNCEVCKDSNAQAHHDDYTRPLDVRWLCTRHHSEWHKENTPKYE